MKLNYAYTVAALVLVFLVGGHRHAAGATTRPNIVLFIADDYSWHDAGCYGATDARTPNVDTMAKQGLRFELAFAPSPTCSPSRSSLLTGLYPMRNGAHANHSLIREGVRTLPQYMKELGYRVVLAGKTHIGPREQFPFEFLPDSNVMPPGKEGVLWTDLNTGAVDRLLESHDKTTPLCLIVASHSPHVFWPDETPFRSADVVPPPYLLDTPETHAARAKYLGDVSHMDEQLGDVRRSLAKHGYADGNTLLMFTSDQGAQFPFAKWNLYDAGIRVPLIAVWPEHVKPATTTRAMVSLVDLLATFVDVAGGTPPSGLDSHSFLPVLRGESAKADEFTYAVHTGDKDMNRTPMRSVRTVRFKYIRNLKPETRYTTHISDAGGRDGKVYWDSWEHLAKTDSHAAEVVKRYRQRPAEELYDVEADPYELENLAGDSKHADTLKELRENLDAWRVKQGEDLNKVPMPEDARHGEVPYAQ